MGDTVLPAKVLVEDVQVPAPIRWGWRDGSFALGGQQDLFVHGAASWGNDLLFRGRN